MALPRRTLVLIVVLILAIAAAGAVWFMFPEKIDSVFGGKKGGTNTNIVVENTNTTTANLSTPQDLSGDTPLTATVKIGTTEVKFTSLDRLGNFDQTAAPANQQHLILYFEGLNPADTSTVFTALNGAQIVDGDKRYSIVSLKVASNIVKNDRGYAVFLIPTTTGKLTFEVGTGPDLQRVDLP